MNYWRKLFLNVAIIVAVNCVSPSAGNPSKDQPPTFVKTSYDFNDVVSSLRSPSDGTPLAGKTPIFDIRVDPLPDQCQWFRNPTNCAEAPACTKRSGYYRIQLDAYNSSPFLLECDAHTDGGDWTVIQRRQDGSVDFYRTWSEYKAGFGDIDGEYFIGLDKLYALTNFDAPQELLIQMVMQNTSGIFSAEAKYNSFAIGSESEKYFLKRVGTYSGTAGDSLTEHIGSKFTTKDVNNGNASGENCAIRYMGAWWYKACHLSNLNGHYGDIVFGKGINWYTFNGYTNSLKTVTMMIRRRRY